MTIYDICKHCGHRVYSVGECSNEDCPMREGIRNTEALKNALAKIEEQAQCIDEMREALEDTITDTRGGCAPRMNTVKDARAVLEKWRKI